MKHMRTLLLIFCLIFGSMQSSEWIPAPEHTFFAFDIDEVLAEESYFQKPNLVFVGMWQDPSNSHHWISSLMNLKNAYKKDECGKTECLLDKQGNEVNGLAFHFLYHGMNDLNITSYVPWVVNILEASRVPIQGTVEVCEYLKYKKGYTVVFATNKDRPSYDVFAKNIGTKVTSLPERVFVAHPGNSDSFLQTIATFITQEDVPANYKTFAHEALTVQPTEHIRHIPALKPNPEYYQQVHETVQKEFNKKNMVFIDDRQPNIDGVESYNQQTGAHVIGITFKNPYLLTKHLVKLRVLSVDNENDKEFINKMKKYKIKKRGALCIPLLLILGLILFIKTRTN